MTGLTTMVVPRGLGLVAALAVSGTALYFVYELNRKKTLGSIRRGKGSLRVEYHVRPHEQQPEQQQQHTTQLHDSGGVGRGLRDGNEVGSVEIHCQHLPCLRRATRRQPEQSLNLNAVASGSGSLQGNVSQEDGKKFQEDGLGRCSADEAQVNPAESRSSLSCYARDARDGQPREGSVCCEPLQNNTVVVGFMEKNSDRESLDALYKLDRGSSDSLSSTDDSEEYSAQPIVDNLVLQTSSSSSDEDCSSKPVSLAAASSLSAPSTDAAAPPQPPRSFAIVGCFVHSGNGTAAGKRKKVVRFSPSVTEPSSNNQDYRRRFKTQMAQKADRNRHQTTKEHASTAGRSIVYGGPRMYSQAARQAVTYSVQRGSYHYGGRSC